MGALVSSSELAKALGVTPTRVSQYVREGKLTGCYTGDGRSRRFDLDKVANALGRRLHPGQMMGNGAATKAALAEIKAATAAPAARAFDGLDRPDMIRLPVQPEPPPRADEGDQARYEIARAAKMEEELRKLRRANAEAEGKYVLASEVEAATARIMAQEVAVFDEFLRVAARTLADKLGVEFKAVRQILMDQNRTRRASRASVLEQQAAEAKMTAREEDEDI